jgi:hypothetical protein
MGRDLPVNEPAAQDHAEYSAILHLTELELELIGEGRYIEAAQLRAQRAQIMDGLSAPRPPQARELLERALALQRRVSIELMRRREEVLLSLRRIELSRRAATGYGRSLPDQPHSRGIHIEG